jgi:hypothetical protein
MPAFEFNDDPAIARYAENMLIPMAGVIHDPDDLADFCYAQADLWEKGGDPGDEKIAAFLNHIGDGLATPEGDAKALEKIMAAFGAT